MKKNNKIVKKETLELLKQYSTSNEYERRKIESKIYDLNTPLIYSTLKSFSLIPDTYPDVFQEASKGMIDAVRRFNPNVGAAFSTFAVNTMKGVVKNMHRDKIWLVKVSREDKEKGVRISALSQMEEDALDMPELEKQRIKSLINAQHPSDLTSTMIENTPDLSPTIEQRLFNPSVAASKILLDQLPDEHKEILQLHFVEGFSPEELSISFLLDVKEIQAKIDQAIGYCKSLKDLIPTELIEEVYEN